MYWLRAANLSGPVLWLSVAAGWGLGGWLIATHAFALKKDARLIAGFAIGLTGYLVFAGFLVHWMPPTFAFPASALPVIALGLALARRQTGPWLQGPGRDGWRLIAVALLLAGLFTRLGKGLADTADLDNLPVLSALAAGHWSPETGLTPSMGTGRAGGFHLLGASLMQPGGLFPWSALDLSNGLIWGLGISLAFLVGRRASDHPLAGPGTAALLVFASGTRYLLLLLPAESLGVLQVQLVPPGGMNANPISLSQALAASWPPEGGPPLAYPMAFLNGALPPYAISHAGSVGLSITLLLLLWLLAPRAEGSLAFLPLGVLFTLWGFTLATSYLAAAIALPALLISRRVRPVPPALRQTAWGLALSVPLVLADNGLLSGELLPAVRFHWPPAVPAAPFCPLALDSGSNLLLAVFEIGPILLLAPALTLRIRQVRGTSAWFSTMLATYAWIALALALFLEHPDREVNATLMRHALLAWTLLLAEGFWSRLRDRRTRPPFGEAAVLGLMVLGGAVAAGFHLSAGSRAVLASGINGLDARVARDVWGKLPEAGGVMDPNPARATTLTGLPGRPPPDPLPSGAGLLARGFRYVYVEVDWWTALPAGERAALSDDCVRVLSEQYDPDRTDFRRLLDLGACGMGQPDDPGLPQAVWTGPPR